MAWIKLDDNFFRNPKIVGISPESKLIYLAGLCYAGSQLTDGFIPKNAVRILGSDADVPASKRRIQELLDAGLWVENPHGYDIHDYLEHNQSSSKVRENQRAARERMQRNRSRNVRANNERSSREVREPDTDTDTDTDTKGVNTPKPPEREPPSKPLRYPEHFETFWRAYPSGHGVKKQAFEQWKKIPATERQAVMDGLAAWKACGRWQRGFVRDAQRWLRDRQWTDDPPQDPDTSLSIVGGRPSPVEVSRSGADEIRREMGWATRHPDDDVIETTARRTS